MDAGTWPPDAASFLPQAELARATSWVCPCGCASINFAIKGYPAPTGGLRPLADFVFGEGDELSGIFIFEQGGYWRASRCMALRVTPLGPFPIRRNCDLREHNSGYHRIHNLNSLPIFVLTPRKVASTFAKVPHC
jgi:hypothetical protein